MVANAGKSTSQCVRKLMVVIRGYLEWPQIFHLKKVTNIHLYRGIPNISEVIPQRRFRLVCHCIRHIDELVHNLILWKPNGIRNRGRQPNN